MKIVKFVMLCGIPGAGKSTYAEQFNRLSHNSYMILSSDKIREELLGSAEDQSNNALIFKTMHERALMALDKGISVIYDATNMTRKDRNYILSILPKYVATECHIVWAPIATCIDRDAARSRSVGKDVIMRMVRKFQMPYYDEGFTNISVVRMNEVDLSYSSYSAYLNFIMESMKIPHDNPHHTLSVYDHAIECQRIVIDNYGPQDIVLAAKLHDCGKPFVKTFTNRKGEATDIAHYYDHQNVGAWIACGLTTSIDVIWLINMHMAPYLNEKYYKQLPSFLKTKVDILHDADIHAH